MLRTNERKLSVLLPKGRAKFMSSELKPHLTVQDPADTTHNDRTWNIPTAHSLFDSFILYEVHVDDKNVSKIIHTFTKLSITQRFSNVCLVTMRSIK